MSIVPALISVALASAGATQQTGAVPQTTVIALPTPGQTELPPAVTGEGAQPVEAPTIDSLNPRPGPVRFTRYRNEPARCPMPRVIARLLVPGNAAESKMTDGETQRRQRRHVHARQARRSGCWRG